MPTQAFDVGVRTQPQAAVIDLEGEINAAAGERLNVAYGAASQSRPAAILLNFASVSYINSTGIALIVNLLAQSRAAGIRLLACGLNDHYREIFQITRLADYMAIYPDEESALHNLNSTASVEE